MLEQQILQTAEARMRQMNPRNFTENERFIEEVREAIYASGLTFDKLAGEDMAGATVQRLASGKTRWPRPTTLFPILDRLGLRMTLQSRGRSR